MVFVNEILDITVESSTIPKCPACQGVAWVVHEKITRQSNLERVDGLRDLVVSKRDEGTYDQALLLECSTCEAKYFPQADVKSYEAENATEKIEAYSTNLYEWPGVVTNEVSYE